MFLKFCRQYTACVLTAARIAEVSRTLNAGRRARVGYSAVDIGSTRAARVSNPRSSASSCIATAKSYQLAMPRSDQW